MVLGETEWRYVEMDQTCQYLRQRERRSGHIGVYIDTYSVYYSHFVTVPLPTTWLQVVGAQTHCTCGIGKFEQRQRTELCASWARTVFPQWWPAWNHRRGHQGCTVQAPTLHQRLLKGWDCIASFLENPKCL
jgi:hypothetical protein